MPPEKRQQILDLLAAGWTQKKVAEKLGVHRSTVRRAKLQAEAEGQEQTPAAETGDPTRRLQALRDGFLTVAESVMEDLLEKAEKGKSSSQKLVQAKIAQQAAIEAKAALDHTHGLPDELPDDDEDKRETVLKAWYHHAKNSSTAARQLAAALGIKSAATQPVQVIFERPVPDEDGEAPPSPALPGEDPRLH